MGAKDEGRSNLTTMSGTISIPDIPLGVAIAGSSSYSNVMGDTKSKETEEILQLTDLALLLSGQLSMALDGGAYGNSKGGKIALRRTSSS